jgi:hypothetical protein
VNSKSCISVSVPDKLLLLLMPNFTTDETCIKFDVFYEYNIYVLLTTFHELNIKIKSGHQNNQIIY